MGTIEERRRELTASDRRSVINNAQARQFDESPDQWFPSCRESFRGRLPAGHRWLIRGVGPLVLPVGSLPVNEGAA